MTAPTRLQSLPDPLTAGTLLRAFREARGWTREEAARSWRGDVAHLASVEESARFLPTGGPWAAYMMLMGAPVGDVEPILRIMTNHPPDSPLYAALRHALAVACGVGEEEAERKNLARESEAKPFNELPNGSEVWDHLGRAWTFQRGPGDSMSLTRFADDAGDFDAPPVFAGAPKTIILQEVS